MTLQEAIIVTLNELGEWNSLQLLWWAMSVKGRFKDHENATPWLKREVSAELEIMRSAGTVRRRRKNEWRTAP